MPDVLISPHFRQVFLDENGNPAEGWKIWTYESNTTTLKDTYSNPEGTVKHTNPIIVQPGGLLPGMGLYLIANEAYTIKILDQDDAPVPDGTVDLIYGVGPGGSGTNTDENVKVSENDTTAGFLSEKLVSSDNSVDYEILDPNDDEKLDLTVDRGLVAVNDSDTTLKRLADAIKDGSNTTVETFDQGGGNLGLRVNAAAMATDLQGAYDASPSGKEIQLAENEPINCVTNGASQGPNFEVFRLSLPGTPNTLASRVGVLGNNSQSTNSYFERKVDGEISFCRVSNGKYEFPNENQNIETDDVVRYAQNYADENFARCETRYQNQITGRYTWAFAYTTETSAEDYLEYFDENENQSTTKREAVTSSSYSKIIEIAQESAQLFESASNDNYTRNYRAGETGNNDRCEYSKVVTPSSGYQVKAELIRNNGGGIWTTKYSVNEGLVDSSYDYSVKANFESYVPFENKVNFSNYENVTPNSKVTQKFNRISDQEYVESGWAYGDTVTYLEEYRKRHVVGGNSLLTIFAGKGNVSADSSAIILGKNEALSNSIRLIYSETQGVRCEIFKANGDAAIWLDQSFLRTECIIYSKSNDLGSNADTTTDVNWLDSNTQDIATTGTTATIAFATDAPAGATVRLIIFASQATSITWPSSVQWSGGTAPTITAGVNVVSFAVSDKSGSLTYYGLHADGFA